MTVEVHQEVTPQCTINDYQKLQAPETLAAFQAALKSEMSALASLATPFYNHWIQKHYLIMPLRTAWTTHTIYLLSTSLLPQLLFLSEWLDPIVAPGGMQKFKTWSIQKRSL